MQHALLLKKVGRRVQDTAVMHLLKMILKATGKKGVPQGGVVSPLLSNVYLTEVDRMLEKAITTTRRGKYTHVQYAHFADDLVILIDSHPRQDWLVKAVENDAKGAAWPLIRSECFSFGGCGAKEVPRISQLVIPKRPSCYEL